MAFNAQEFRSRLVQAASPNLFEMSIPTVPNLLLDSGFEILQDLRMRTYQTELPSAQLETVERITNGPERKVPYGVEFSTLSLYIIEDEKYKVRKFFDLWYSKIFSMEDSYVIPYYDDIIIPEMYLITYDKQGEKQNQYTFYDAFPIVLGPSRLGWDVQNEILVIPISFSYREFKNSVSELV